MTNYKDLLPDETPFSPEGLTTAEIEAFFRDAKDKNEAAMVLADCCDARQSDMVDFLTDRGLISGMKIAKLPVTREGERARAAAEKARKILELAEKGLSMKEVAEVMGIPLNTVRSTAARNGIHFSGGRKKTVKKQEERPMEKKNLTPERDYKAENKALQAEIDELKAVIKELGVIKEEHRILVDKCERQTEENRWIRQKLEAVEAERDRLEAQMEIVYLLCGRGSR